MTGDCVRTGIRAGQAVGAVLLLLASGWVHAASPRLDLPLDCIPGFDCFIQNYPDVDSTRDASDHACGDMTYDGHSGTDFRLPDLRAMRRGVAVKAAAGGVVKRTRDGVPDNEDRREAAASVATDKACGNGVVVDHGDGWTTQYCHMRQGSIRVKPNETVPAGAVLGMVGMSGLAEFPHLHLSLRKGETVLDPFTRLSLEAGCGADGASLWTDATTYALAYRTAAVLNAGFAAMAVTDDDIETGRFDDFRLTANSPALVFFGRAIGLVAGDVEVIEIRGPDGAVLISLPGEPLDRVYAQKFSFAGRKAPKAGWKQGVYVGTYRIIRSGAIVSEVSKKIELQ